MCFLPLIQWFNQCGIMEPFLHINTRNTFQKWLRTLIIKLLKLQNYCLKCISTWKSNLIRVLSVWEISKDSELFMHFSVKIFPNNLTRKPKISFIQDTTITYKKHFSWVLFSVIPSESNSITSKTTFTVPLKKLLISILDISNWWSSFNKLIFITDLKLTMHQLLPTLL